MSAERPSIILRLYLAGDAPHSAAALANLRLVTAELPARRCQIEIVDVFTDPQRALDDGVLLTPTLLRVAPAPPLRLIGDLRDFSLVRHALGLEAP